MNNIEYIIDWLNTNTRLNTQSIHKFAKDVERRYTDKSEHGSEAKFVCRHHSKRTNCRDYRNNKNTCSTCVHLVEPK